MKNQFVWAFSLFVLFIVACKPATTSDETTKSMDQNSTETTTPAPAEFADPKYADIVEKGMVSLASGDVTAWFATFADNVVYAYNYGDSIVGKPAVIEYWTNRRGNIIDILSFEKPILLGVKVNTPQSIEQPGVWVLGWWETHATYSTGKSMVQWIHTDTHFDANDKIDRIIQYVDRQLINEANKK